MSNFAIKYLGKRENFQPLVLFCKSLSIRDRIRRGGCPIRPSPPWERWHGVAVTERGYVKLPQSA